MKKVLLKLLLIGMGVSLSACTTYSVRQPAQPVPSQYEAEKGTGETVGGGIGGPLVDSMDSIDKEKLSHALDNPLGKSTHWSNQSSGISYTVTPIAKVTVGDNSFCRRYTISASKGNRNQQVTGTACVESSSGSWKSV